MLISAEQLARIVLEMFQARSGIGTVDLTSPPTVWKVIQSDYPEVDGIKAPPSEASIRRQYIAEFFSDYNVPDAENDPGPSMNQEASEAIAFNREMRIRFGESGPPSPSDDIIDGLDSLRGNPMSALSFITSIAMGCNRDESMRVARVCGGIYALVEGTDGSSASKSSEKTAKGTGGEDSSKPPEPYKSEEIRARLSRGYSGGA